LKKLLPYRFPCRRIVEEPVASLIHAFVVATRSLLGVSAYGQYGLVEVCFVYDLFQEISSLDNRNVVISQ
jgi:hypothetical protein